MTRQAKTPRQAAIDHLYHTCMALYRDVQDKTATEIIVNCFKELGVTPEELGLAPKEKVCPIYYSKNPHS